MIISEALEIAVTKNTGIYRKDKYPRAEGMVIPTNTKHGCIFVWKYQGYSKIILNWSPCASDLLSDQWEVYEMTDLTTAIQNADNRCEENHVNDDYIMIGVNGEVKCHSFSAIKSKGEKDLQKIIQATTTRELLNELKRRGAVRAIKVGTYQQYEIIAKYGANPIDGSAEVLIVGKDE